MDSQGLQDRQADVWGLQDRQTDRGAEGQTGGQMGLQDGQTDVQGLQAAPRIPGAS